MSGGARIHGVDSIREEVARRVNELTPAEKRCARVLLADYPAAGLASAASLAETAGTSTPTVLRFVAHLGFGNYRTFQQHLRDEITRTAMSPVRRASRSRSERDKSTNFTTAFDQRIGIAEQLIRTVSPAEFDSAVSLLAARPRRTLVSGGYFTHHLAGLLASQLDQLLPGVLFTREPLQQDVGKYLDIGKDGLVILFDFRRSEDAAKRLAALTKERGASLIIITDHEMVPSVRHADVVLPAYVDGIPFDSDAGVLILVECLVTCVFSALGQKAINRMERWEASVKIPRAGPSNSL